MADYWPESLRTSKLSFIPGRVIFSLFAINKIIESIFTDCLTRCRDLRYEIEKADPIACAYVKDRGTESCNAISYTYVEYAMNKWRTAAIQIAADLQKAFNKANRPKILTELQITSQSAELARTRFHNRWYEFKGQKRGLGPLLKTNQGTDAGSALAVFYFGTFMDSDCHFSNFNKYVLWSSYYSDDRCPIISAKDISESNSEICGAQATLDGTWQWAKEHSVTYHTLGKKACEILIFQKTIDNEKVHLPSKLHTYDSENELNNQVKRCHLNLGGTDIVVVEEMTVLGLKIATTPLATIF